MLKDLEQQRLQAEPAAILRDVQMADGARATARTGMLVLLAAVFIAACTATWYIWDQFYFSASRSNSAAQPTVMTQVDNPQQTAAQAGMSEVAVKPAPTQLSVQPDNAPVNSIPVNTQQTNSVLASPVATPKKVATASQGKQLSVSQQTIAEVPTSQPVTPHQARAPLPLTKKTVATASPLRQIPVSKQVIVTPLADNSRPLQKKPVANPVPQPVARPARIEKSFRPLNKDQQAQQEYQQALGLLHIGKVALAEQSLNRALVLDKRHIQAREQLAALLLREQRYDELTSLLLAGIQEHPQHSPFVQMYARLLLDQGLTGQAIQVLEGFTADVKSNPEHYAMLAAAYQRNGQHEKAVQAYRFVLAVQPHRAVWWLGMAISLEALHETKAALGAFRRAQASQRLQPELSRFVSERIRQLELRG